MAQRLMPNAGTVDTHRMETHAVRHRPDTTPADGAMESLERVLGEHWGRAMWVDACRRAGVSPRASHTVADLRRIAAELTEVGGPAATIGRTLGGYITVYEGLTTSRTAA
jgi:hypothetical protein